MGLGLYQLSVTIATPHLTSPCTKNRSPWSAGRKSKGNQKGQWQKKLYCQILEYLKPLINNLSCKTNIWGESFIQKPHCVSRFEALAKGMHFFLWEECVCIYHPAHRGCWKPCGMLLRLVKTCKGSHLWSKRICISVIRPDSLMCSFLYVRYQNPCSFIKLFLISAETHEEPKPERSWTLLAKMSLSHMEISGSWVFWHLIGTESSVTEVQIILNLIPPPNPYILQSA